MTQAGLYNRPLLDFSDKVHQLVVTVSLFSYEERQKKFATKQLTFTDFKKMAVNQYLSAKQWKVWIPASNPVDSQQPKVIS